MSASAHGSPGRGEDPAWGAPGPGDFPAVGSGRWRLLPSGTDWMDDAELREAYLASLAGEDEPGDPELEEDPDNSPPPGLDDAQLAELVAGARVVNATGFAQGRLVDGGPGCTALMGFAGEAAGDDDRYAGACDDELVGAICAWDRVEAHAAARKHAAVAELIRRRPEPGCAAEGEVRMPQVWDEFTPAELASALAESRGAAEGLLDLAWDLQVKLPGTMAAFRSGTLRQRKVEIIARATGALDPKEARAAEELVLGRAGRLTPGGLRAAIARAVMQVAPEEAARRREEAAKNARVERWAEDSGNAALAGRELPPAEVLAADQRVTWWAQQLKKAGLDGDMDQLRARAYLDILLDMDSRPGRAAGDGADGSALSGQAAGDGADDKADPGDGGPDSRGDREPGSRGDRGPGGQGDGRSGTSGRTGPAGPRGRPGAPAPGLPGAGAIPPGFAGRVTATVPLATLLDLADRPGEIPGIGPIDPALARDLARAAARNPKTTWCVTVTDQDGHAIGHGCAQPEPKSRRTDPAQQQKPAMPGGHDPPGTPGNTGRASGAGGTGNRDGPPAPGQPPGPADPRFAFTLTSQDGPSGGYGTWRLSTGLEGQPDLLVAIGPIPAGKCDHRHQADGHDPGVMLRHLTQVRHATCTGPGCRRPAAQCDFEHNTPYEAGGRTCMCNGDPKCRYDHRLKQDPRWTAEKLPDGSVRWTTPARRQYTTEPTRYPI